MYTISKTFHFSASHQLDGLPEGHKCARLHGHNYQVELILQFHQLDEHGFVVDYGDLKPFETYINEHLDHRHLNDVLRNIQTTAERIARHLWQVAAHLWPGYTIVVRISETPLTWASYTQGGA